ncbi:WD repeat-containing protein 74 isoform X1 [Rattus norvegicus]|uniref:WD repeat-containing protein 74 isoform X1 n=1 Tax=Rattus norvegicus TaxID=10116 RepID=UPI0003D0EE7B|nr:WD repeat-containing protein 74 isoform X2 [Rattus norvegicus]XP_032747468.1 WD repeat-containing protein 74 isoform X2 [Rattus rattus]|eukprot:XP_006231062.1 PREDICTED: WD repeat-containing protein 74 isoform X2 [Rattus norvegicus]
MAATSARWNHVWVGTETGILKGVNLQRKLAANFTPSGQPRREEAVNALCWGTGGETQILVGCADRTVRHFNAEEGTFQSQRYCPGGEGTFRGLAQADDGTLITCVDSGILRVWCENDKEASSDPLLELKVRNDWLDLRVPIWDQDIQFLPGSQKLVTCTGYHQVRIYDPASPQRRPVLEATYGEYPLTAMTLTPEGNSVIVGNTHGQLAEIDFRQGRLLGCLKGLAGSVRGLQCHPSKPLLASCGLDRVLRIHRIRNPRGLEHKVYLKSQLNCLLLSGRDNWEDEPQEPQEPNLVPPEDTETDELWASLEAAAKRKLPDLDQKQGALQRRKKKKRPGSTSP